jgi:ABC-type nitrate/sulfonate/bicarbonate transport system substrate-binding protein
MRFLSYALSLLLTLIFGSLAGAAESKTINIGWTGGSGWTALPDRVASERGFYEK